MNREIEPTYRPFKSSYFEQATIEIKKYLAETSTPSFKEGVILKKLKYVLTETDKLGVDNLQLYESTTYPGVIFSFTTVDLAKIKEGRPTSPDEDTLHFIFGGFPIVPVDGTPFMSWDMIYDAVVHNLGLSANTTIVALGSHLAPGGKVTKEWIEAIKHEKNAAYGKLYGEMVNNYIEEYRKSHPEMKKLRVIIHSMSHGAVAATHIDVGGADRVQRLLDNPISSRAQAKDSVLKGIQICFGFLAEGVINAIRNPVISGRIEEDKRTIKDILRKIDELGASDSKEEYNMKLLSKIVELLLIVRGNKLPIGKFDHIRRGKYDLTSANWIQVLKSQLLQISSDNEESLPDIVPSENPTEASQLLQTSIDDMNHSPEISHSENPVEASHFFPRTRLKRWKEELWQLVPNTQQQ